MPNSVPPRGCSPAGGSTNENLLRNEVVLRGILTRLDESRADEQPAAKGRRAGRLPYRRNDLRLTVTHPGGGTVERAALGHDLSATGASVVYEGFLHTGTDCQLLLRRRMTGHDVARAKVVACRHLHGAYHLVDIDFTEPVIPKIYVDPASFGSLADGGEVNPAALTGTVVLLDDQKLEHALAAHCLRGTSVNLVPVRTTSEALLALRSGTAQVLLVDLNLAGGERGEQAIVKCRETGFRGGVVVLSAETNADRIAAAWAAGANGVLHKPYTREQLLRTLSNLLDDADARASAEPIYSELLDAAGRHPDAETLDLVRQFVDNMRDSVASLRKAIDDDSVADVRTLCQLMKGTGKSYGFAAVTDAAAEALRSLDTTQSIDESLGELRRLESTCHRLQSKPRYLA